jgi:Mrp family chromosome partitioning ATPase
VGFTAPKAKAGVTSLCLALATATAASGLRTLLVDLSGPAEEGTEMPDWLPGSGRAPAAIRPNPSPGQFDKLTARTTSETRDLFNNSAEIRRTLTDELSDYGAVIVDIPPLKPGNPGAIDAASAAAACGSVYLVCASGEVTKTEMLDSVNRLQSAGVTVLGLILNEAGNPSVGAELAGEVLRFKEFAPEWTGLIAKKLLESSFLN